MSKKLNEVQVDLVSHLLQAINSAKAAKVLPTLQKDIGMPENGFSAKMGLLSSYTGTPKIKSAVKHRKIVSKRIQNKVIEIATEGKVH